MASNFASSKAVILKNVRLAWADIHTPGEGLNGGAAKYKVSVLLEKGSDAFTLAQQAMLEAARGLWRDNAANMIKSMPENSRFLRDGNNKMDDDGNVRDEYKDMWFVSASNKVKPQVIGPRKHNGVFPTLTEDNRAIVGGMDVTHELGWEAKSPYRGCYVNIKITAVAGKSFKGSDGNIIPNQVYAKIEAVQFLRDGDAFGISAPNADGFDEEEVEVAANNEDNDLF